VSGFQAVVVPSTLLLLPTYAGADDPVPTLRSAVRSAVATLVASHSQRLLLLVARARQDNAARGVTDPAATRIGRHLLEEAGFTGEVVTTATAWKTGTGVLVVANGSATRSENAPGHLDGRGAVLDDAIDAALRKGDSAALGGLDAALAEAVWCHDAPTLRALAGVVGDAPVSAEVTYADDPFGVQYWVAVWQCGS
jgi:hypothetical protein